MQIIEDTRQKVSKHTLKHKVWNEHGDVITRCMLPAGDYALPPGIVVDTKADLTEIAGNLLGSYKEQQRVIKEIKKANSMGTKIIFLIEQDRIKSGLDLMELQIQCGNGRIVNGTDLLLKMQEYRHLYDCDFTFCSPSKAADVIKTLLLGYNTT